MDLVELIFTLYACPRRPSDGDGLVPVVELRRGPVGVDVADVGRGQAGVAKGGPHATLGTFAFGAGAEMW